MSRPFRFLLSAVMLTGALGFTGCVGTIYDPMYSNRNTHFKAPEERTRGEASAESILGAVDSHKTGGAGADAGGLPPAAGSPDIPGLPAPGLPEAAPGAPAAPAPAAPPQ
jgi:hypothetical protein